jgi:ATP-dependent DNA helicase RecG
MAIPASIHNLLSGREVEWARIEFKTTWDPEASLKTICAFANDLDNWGGGYIVIGVEEKNGIPQRPLVGAPLDKVDEWQKSIFNKCKMISPDYSPIIDKQEYENKTFLVIWCPGGYGRP